MRLIWRACKSKCKAIPLRALTGREGSRRLRLPDFKTIGTWRWKGCQPYAPAAFTPLPPKDIFTVLTSVRGWVNPRDEGRVLQENMVLVGTLLDMCTISFVFGWWKRERSIVWSQQDNSTATMGENSDKHCHESGLTTEPFVVTLLKLPHCEVRCLVPSKQAVLDLGSMDPLEVRG